VPNAQLSLFEPAVAPCIDKVLGELPREWTWIGQIAQRGLWPDGLLVSSYAPDEYRRQIDREQRCIRRCHAAVRRGLLEGATLYRPGGLDRDVVVADGAPVPKWISRYPATKGMGSCYVVRLRRAA